MFPNAPRLPLRHSLSGTDMEAHDYDKRTALHVAASEGHYDIVEFLVKNCNVHPTPKVAQQSGSYTQRSL